MMAQYRIVVIAPRGVSMPERQVVVIDISRPGKSGGYSPASMTAFGIVWSGSVVIGPAAIAQQQAAAQSWIDSQSSGPVPPPSPEPSPIPGPGPSPWGGDGDSGSWQGGGTFQNVSGPGPSLWANQTDWEYRGGVTATTFASVWTDSWETNWNVSSFSLSTPLWQQSAWQNGLTWGGERTEGGLWGSLKAFFSWLF